MSGLSIGIIAVLVRPFLCQWNDIFISRWVHIERLHWNNCCISEMVRWYRTRCLVPPMEPLLYQWDGTLILNWAPVLPRQYLDIELGSCTSETVPWYWTRLLYYWDSTLILNSALVLLRRYLDIGLGSCITETVPWYWTRLLYYWDGTLILYWAPVLLRQYLDIELGSCTIETLSSYQNGLLG